MKKVVILGCENSHADLFLQFLEEKPEFAGVEVVGVYSVEREAAEKLHQRFGVPVMETFGELAGQVDGVIVTARHGDKHYPFAEPYLQAGVTLFLDKPVAIREEDAILFLSKTRQLGVKVTGGSCLRYAGAVAQAKAGHDAAEGGNTVGGVVRSPMNCDPQYGGFYFYAQHVVDMVMEIFGHRPESVQATTDKNGVRTVIFHYANYNVVGVYTEGSSEYFALRFGINGSQGGQVTGEQLGDCFYTEFQKFYDLLMGGQMTETYEDLFSPVFVMNAIQRATVSGKPEKIIYK